MRIIGVLVALVMLSGCIDPVVEEGGLFTLQTLDRAEDSGASYSLKGNQWKSSTYYPDQETISEIETQYQEII